MDSVVGPRVAANFCIFCSKSPMIQEKKEFLFMCIPNRFSEIIEFHKHHKLQGKPCLSTTSAPNMMPILSLQRSDSRQSVIQETDHFKCLELYIVYIYI